MSYPRDPHPDLAPEDYDDEQDGWHACPICDADCFCIAFPQDCVHDCETIHALIQLPHGDSK